MSQEIMCDFCGNRIHDEHEGVISGQMRFTLKLNNKNKDAIITFVNHYGDRENIDICSNCLEKGGIGGK